MIDKSSEKVLTFVYKSCEAGKFKVFNKKSLLENFNGLNKETLYTIVNNLAKNEFIDIKYSDDEVYCFTILQNGISYVENKSTEKKQIKKQNSSKIYRLIIFFLLAFIGAFAGTYVANLLR